MTIYSVGLCVAIDSIRLWVTIHLMTVRVTIRETVHLWAGAGVDVSVGIDGSVRVVWPVEPPD